MKIISARKPNISKELKFPIGFESIESVFKDVDLERNLYLGFDDKLGGRMGIFTPYSYGKQIALKNESRELLDFRKILTISYSGLTEKFTLIINPCEKINAKIYSTFLTKTALNLTKNWFLKERNETWFEGQRFFQIGLNEDFSKFCVLETQNEYVINKSIEHCKY